MSLDNGAAGSILVPTGEPDVYIVLGEELPGYCTDHSLLLSDGDLKQLEAAVARSLGVLNLAAQAVNGWVQTKGLVRIAPESMGALKAGATPLTKDGWFLGTLVREGKFVHQVRWLPAGSAGTVGVLAGIGPALALMAMQWQLSEISRQVREGNHLTSIVLDLVRGEQWAEVRGQHDAVLSEYQHAITVGAVTPAIWAHVQAQASEATLRKDMHLFHENVQRHLRQMQAATTATGRREWIQSNGEAVLRDVDASFMAHRAWLLYQALRIGSLSTSENERDRALRDELVREVQQMRETVAADCERLVDSLHRHFRLMQVCPGGVGLTIRGRKQHPKEVAHAAEVLASHIWRLRGKQHAGFPCLEPTYGWTGVAPEDKPLIVERLRWILTPGEELLSVAGGSTTWPDWRSSDGWVVFTDQRILLFKRKTFLKDAEANRDIPWSSDISVAAGYHKNVKGGPDLALGGPEHFRVQFRSTTPWQDVEELARLLRPAKPRRAARPGRRSTPLPLASS